MEWVEISCAANKKEIALIQVKEIYGMKVKIIFVFITFFLMQTVGLSQTVDSVEYISKNKVSFVTMLDKNNATKDGYYVNGYVVNIDYETGQNLHMKKIKITGKVTIVKGLKRDKPGGPIRQGRYNDAKHILKPKIEIVN